MYYILRKIKGERDWKTLHVAKEEGCRTLAVAEKWVEKEITSNPDPRFTYIIVKDVVSYVPQVTMQKQGGSTGAKAKKAA